MCVYVFEFHDKKSDKWKFIAAMLERLVWFTNIIIQWKRMVLEVFGVDGHGLKMWCMLLNKVMFIKDVSCDKESKKMTQSQQSLKTEIEKQNIENVRNVIDELYPKSEVAL